MTKHPLPNRRGTTLTLVAILAAAAATCAAVAPSASASAARPGPAARTVTTARTTARTTAPTAAQLTTMAQQDVDAGAPGVIVRVDDGRGPVIKIARQAAPTKADHRLSPNDEFRMGSNTKTMVATLVLQMVAEHRMALDDPIEKYLPGLIPNGQAITLRMLLNHTSGLFNYVYDPAVLRSFSGQDTRSWTPRQLLAVAVTYPPGFAPGTQFSYSNTGYIALGLALEKVTGRPIAELIQQRIAGPLHLKHTYLSTGSSRPDRRDRAELAHGYEPDAAHIAPLLPPGTPAGTAFVGPQRGNLVDTTWINSSTQWAAGAMISTAADWARFDQALLSGKLIPQAELTQMRTTVPEDPSAPDGNGYGLGLRKVVTPCGTVWGHDGQVGGYNSVTYTDSAGRRTVAVLTSTVFGLVVPKTGAANQALEDAAVCTMLDKPVPAGGTD
jgi:D-alanyl-D-alanine carboxypeptidase